MAEELQSLLDRIQAEGVGKAEARAAEIVAASYRDSFFRPEGRVALATARAGNVIGGGDNAPSIR